MWKLYPHLWYKYEPLFSLYSLRRLYLKFCCKQKKGNLQMIHRHFSVPRVNSPQKFIPVKVLSNWYFPVDFWTSGWWVDPNKLLSGNPVISSDSHWCLLGSCQDHNNLQWLFSQNIGLDFLVMIDSFSFCFYWHFMVTLELDLSTWKFRNRNR